MTLRHPSPSAAPDAPAVSLGPVLPPGPAPASPPGPAPTPGPPPEGPPVPMPPTPASSVPASSAARRPHRDRPGEHRPGGLAGVADVVRSVVLWGGALLGLACIVLFVLGLALGWRPQVVVTGSMEPAIPTGSLVVVRQVPAVDVAVGDVVTVPRPHGEGLVTHRVIATEPAGGGASLTLQGDANVSPDPEPYALTTVGREVVTLPGVGFLATLLKTPGGIAAIVVLAAAVLAAYAWQPRDPDEPRAPSRRRRGARSPGLPGAAGEAHRPTAAGAPGGRG